MNWLKSVSGLGVVLLLVSSCSPKGDDLPVSTGDVVYENEVSTETADSITLSSDYYIKNLESFEPTYTPRDYTDDTGCILQFFVPDRKMDYLDDVQNEINWYLKENQYDFSLEFVYTESKEFTSMENIYEQQEEPVDLRITYDYLSGTSKEEFLDLTELAHEASIWESFDTMVWEPYITDDRIYGIPLNPIAADRIVYAYSPQLTDQLELDIDEFQGDLDYVIRYSDYLNEQNILPLLVTPTDHLNCGIHGYEIYHEIFALQHAEDGVRAVDVFDDPEVLRRYQQLGTLRQKDGVIYDVNQMDMLSDEEKEMESEKLYSYQYTFMEETYTSLLSSRYDVNMTEDGYIISRYYIPETKVFLYEPLNHALVIEKGTEHEQECYDFIRLYLTDPEFQRMLYFGIEGVQYAVKDNVLYYSYYLGVPDSGLEFTRRFWPIEGLPEACEEEAHIMNQGVELPTELDLDYSGYEETYQACKEILDQNWNVCYGYYGEDTERRVAELHEQLIDAGYLKLIEYVNAGLAER